MGFDYSGIDIKLSAMTPKILLFFMGLIFGTTLFAADLQVVQSTPLVIQEDLLVSNYPEQIKYPGQIFERLIQGVPLRILYYHQSRLENTVTSSIFISAQNKDDHPITLRITKGMAGPDVDGIFAGHLATKYFIENNLAGKIQKITIQPGARASVVVHSLKANRVSTGIVRIEPETTGNVLVKMQVLDASYPDFTQTNDSKMTYTYGFFPLAIQEMTVTYDVTTLRQVIPIGDEPYLTDPIHRIVLKGNYAVFYQVALVLENPTPYFQTVNLHLSPVAGSVRAVILIDGKLIETGFLSTRTRLKPATLSVFQLSPHETKTCLITMMPQAGSFYPVQLVLQSPSP